jgi:tRNA(fMet)-specific endonuclease VapC
MIDTNIAIHLRDGLESVLRRIEAHSGAVAISALSLAELQRGLYKSPALWASRKARLDTILRSIPILPFDAEAVEAYGRIVAQIGWSRGREFDRMIAGHALATRRVLVTANTADFADVPGLAIENWVIDA